MTLQTRLHEVLWKKLETLRRRAAFNSHAVCQCTANHFCLQPNYRAIAEERNANPIELAEQSGDVSDNPALEATMKSIINRLCRMAVRAQNLSGHLYATVS